MTTVNGYINRYKWGFSVRIYNQKDILIFKSKCFHKESCAIKKLNMLQSENQWKILIEMCGWGYDHDYKEGSGFIKVRPRKRGKNVQNSVIT